MSGDETQQGDPEAPSLSAETFHTLGKQLESKSNIWYLDDGNLADEYKVPPGPQKHSEIGTKLRSELEH